MRNTLKNISFSLTICCLSLVLFLFAPAASMAETETKTQYAAWGDIDLSLNYVERANFNRGHYDDAFNARQRLRAWLLIQPTESLRAIGMVRIASGEWGKRHFSDGRDTGFQADGDGVNLRTRFLFLDWQEKDNPWHARAGLMPVNVPYASYLTGILDTSAGGIEVERQLNDTFRFSAVWARPYDEYRNDESESPSGKKGLDDEMDIFMLKLAMNFRDGISITPWGIYSRIGKDSGYWSSMYAAKINSTGTLPPDIQDHGEAWWAGFAALVPLTEKLSLSLDAAAASLYTGKKPGNYNTRGWQTTGRLEYDLGWGKPGFFGWYGSGSDADKIREDQMWGVVPTISAFDGGFNPTSFGFDTPGGLNLSSYVSTHVGGRWGIGLQIAEMSFFEDFTHTVRVAYYRGTNDKEIAKMDAITQFNSKLGGVDGLLMTTKDSAFEINLNHDWQLHKKVVVYTNMGYMNLNRYSGWEKNTGKHDAWQLSTNLRVHF